MSASNSPARLIVGKIRRFFNVHFRKGYVDRQLESRQGSCLQCAVCCGFTFPCPLLTKDRLCAVYGTIRPKACRVFPIDQKDIEDVKARGGNCGYWFESPRVGH